MPEDEVIYIGPNWTIVDDPDDAIMVKVVSPNGDIKFGYPVDDAELSELGGPGSGNEGHKGRPGKVGGSLPRGTSAVTKGLPNEQYTEYAAKFNTMNETATAKSKDNKKWIKAHQDDYDNDKQFKAIADYATLYSQGSYEEMKAIAHHRMTDSWDDGGLHDWEDSAIPDWEDDDLSIVSNPLAVYKNYFEGQNVEEDLGISTGDAAMIVEKTIANSPELDYPIYRGVVGYTKSHMEYPPGVDPKSPNAWWDAKTIYEKWPPIPKVGETIDFVGATSFSADAQIANAFSLNVAKGQNKRGLGPGAWATFVYEIEGAHGIEVSALSPWHQSEVLTSGRYEVTDIVNANAQFSQRRPAYHVKLKQVGTWDID